jgi:hypothetical protein
VRRERAPPLRRRTAARLSIARLSLHPVHASLAKENAVCPSICKSGHCRPRSGDCSVSNGHLGSSCASVCAAQWGRARAGPDMARVRFASTQRGSRVARMTGMPWDGQAVLRKGCDDCAGELVAALFLHLQRARGSCTWRRPRSRREEALLSHGCGWEGLGRRKGAPGSHARLAADSHSAEGERETPGGRAITSSVEALRPCLRRCCSQRPRFRSR